MVDVICETGTVDDEILVLKVGGGAVGAEVGDKVWDAHVVVGGGYCMPPWCFAVRYNNTAYSTPSYQSKSNLCSLACSRSTIIVRCG